MFLVSRLYLFYVQPVAIVLPHHNLVRNTRQEFLKTVSSRRHLTRKIILLSPDHFSPIQGTITTGKIDWKLSTGTAKYQKTLPGDYRQDAPLLLEDHGLYNPLSDLKVSFPRATFQTFLIGQKTTPQDLQGLLSELKTNCRFDCLLVASVDFSHYLPATLAAAHDAYTLSALNNLDLDKLLTTEVDSPQSLYLLAAFATSRQAASWKLTHHTNSGVIAHHPDIETTTHVFGWYSRGFSRRNSDLVLLHWPENYSRSQSQKTFGDRFFYGFDRVTIDAYPKNFVVSQVETPTSVTKSFLPVSGNSFVVGLQKSELIKSYFDSIRDESVAKDYFWGTLTYVRKN